MTRFLDYITGADGMAATYVYVLTVLVASWSIIIAAVAITYIIVERIV